MYKITPGVTSIDRKKESSWFEVTYHGKKNQSTMDALAVWRRSAERNCPSGRYYVGSLPILSQIITSQHRETFDHILVSYPEANNEKWPQVSARVKCEKLL